MDKPYYLLRKEIFQRDDNQCLSCRNTETLEIHHIIPTKYGGSDDPDNLLTLCKKCHDNAEPKVSYSEMKRLYPQIEKVEIKSYVIRINDDTYEELKTFAQGYGDTMNDIITRLLHQNGS